MLRLSIFLLLLMGNTPTIFAQTKLSTIHPFNAIYEITHNGEKAGTTERTLIEISPNHYRYKVHAKLATVLFFLPVSHERIESSEFKWQNDIPIPLHYTLNTKGIGKKRTANLKFDWQAKKVSNQIGSDKPWKLSIPAGTQDSLSYHFLVKELIAKNKASLEFQVATGGRLKTYRLSVIGNENIKTPAGVFDTTKIKRERKKHITFLWLDNASTNIIRIQQFKDGKEQADMRLKNYVLIQS